MLEGTFPADQCDCCKELGLLVIVPALGAKPEEMGGVRVYYYCRECGYQWWRRYAATADGRLTRTSLSVPRPDAQWVVS